MTSPPHRRGLRRRQSALAQRCDPGPPTEIRARDRNRYVVDKQPYFTRYRLAVLGILLASIAVYLPSLGGMPVWDDRAIMTGWGIGGGKSLLTCFTKPFLLHYYRPFTSLSYFLDIHLFGPNPQLLHQTNILLHALATGLLICLIRALLQDKKAALLAGFFFAIQPAAVGTVAWVGGRCDQLGAVLFIAMTLGAVQFHRSDKKAWLVGSVLCYFTAMMVKEQFALMMALIPLSAFVLRPAPDRARVALWTTMPFLVAAVAFACLWLANFPIRTPRPRSASSSRFPACSERL